MRSAFALAVCLGAGLLPGCYTIGNSSVPIGTVSVPALRPSSERTLIVVLPGLGDDAKDLKNRGVADAIHDAWPEADVLLASATLAYYRDGRLVSRLHDEIVEQARRQAYGRLWLAGASLGGMGALLYEREHPGEVAGIVLLAPYLGSTSFLEEIRAAGGPRSWDPGPLPLEVNEHNYERQVWKMIKGWAQRPEFVRRVWLSSGTSDHRIEDVRLLAQEVPKAHYLELPGGHDWNFGIRAMREIFSRIRAESRRG
ncbi:MAG TPA: alpha/beta hydrolase-fold protein [Burkholderiales bacterium]|jgi:pimeloyl-ACP methyl ester carboxylesterase